MLGLVLIYFLGRSFYTLAETYSKNQWLYAILGVVSYYVGTFVGGICIGLYFELATATPVEEVPDMQLAIIAVPFGLLGCWGFYTFLKRKWEKEMVMPTDTSLDDILDSDILK